MVIKRTYYYLNYINCYVYIYYFVQANFRHCPVSLFECTECMLQNSIHVILCLPHATMLEHHKTWHIVLLVSNLYVKHTDFNLCVTKFHKHSVHSMVRLSLQQKIELPT